MKTASPTELRSESRSSGDSSEEQDGFNICWSLTCCLFGLGVWVGGSVRSMCDPISHARLGPSPRWRRGQQHLTLYPKAQNTLEPQTLNPKTPKPKREALGLMC